MSPRERDLTPLAVQRLIRDPEPYLSCDDCFEQVDVRMEAVLSGSAEPLSAAFRTHLAGCAACLEEAWSLLDLAAEETGRDVAWARARFERALGPVSPDSP